MRATGFSEDIVELLASWLRNRVARVVVERQRRMGMVLVSRLCVRGCILWNVLCSDSTDTIEESGQEQVVHADDLNAWKAYGAIVI